MATQTKTQRNVNQVTESIKALPSDAQITVISNAIGEIARERAVSAFKATIDNIIGQAESVAQAAATTQEAPQTIVTAPKSKHRGRVKGSKNKPKTTVTAAKPTKQSIKGNRVSDHIQRVLAKSGTEMDIASITSGLTKSEGFHTRSADEKKLKGMVRTYLNGLVKDGVVENVKFGIYKSATAKPEQATQAVA